MALHKQHFPNMPVTETNPIDCGGFLSGYLVRIILSPNPTSPKETGTESDLKTPVPEISIMVQTLLQQMQDKFQTMSDQIIGRIDDMSCRIDDLEKNIADLMTQAGVEELEGENKTPAANKS
ncbi:PREDICTED: heat shock factor-binding protein 1 [Charadrius vociferus]|uniref:heat shock factor-binding protein 1 n=1 Tax=Charadrius vociferus TaxID=50402 RepID=UPI000521C71D|nr:PREDICTED: heat shock factor-binding protein 1 [Charadrius vociferus]